MPEYPWPRAPRREPPDREKCFPRYDDVRHIDSNAIDHPAPQAEDYTAAYLAHPDAPSVPLPDEK